MFYMIGLSMNNCHFYLVLCIHMLFSFLSPMLSYFPVFFVVTGRYAPEIDNYGQSSFIRSDLKKIKCVCKTQMMPLPDYQNPVDMHTSMSF
jgi:hypothetical protein